MKKGAIENFEWERERKRGEKDGGYLLLPHSRGDKGPFFLLSAFLLPPLPCVQVRGERGGGGKQSAQVCVEYAVSATLSSSPQKPTCSEKLKGGFRQVKVVRAKLFGSSPTFFPLCLGKSWLGAMREEEEARLKTLTVLALGNLF